MAVAELVTDGWIQHLPFQGRRRETISGPVDGVFYGVISATGDASGGNVTLNGRLSEDRKEDWVYLIKGASLHVNSVTDQDAFIQFNTGPLIPTSTAVTNPTFNFGGLVRGIANNAISLLSGSGSTGPMPFPDMPIFGDKRIPGIFLMAAAGFQTNIDGSLFTLSIWGNLIRYQGFFRNQSPQVG